MQTFYMTVGLPRSGKSHYAKDIPDAIIYSSDVVRQEVMGDIGNRSNQAHVFNTLHNRVLSDLKAGKNVIYDATNVNYRRRMDFLREVDALNIEGLQKVCLFMSIPYEICVKNNNTKDRPIPECVIRNMYLHFDVPMMCEGWDEIRIIDFNKHTNDIQTDRHEILSRLSRFEHDDAMHEFTVGQHCLTTWAYMVGHYGEDNIPLLLAAMFHDIGKEKTKVYRDPDGEPSDSAHYYHHDRVGAYESFFYTGDMPTEHRLAAALLIRWHMTPYYAYKPSVRQEIVDLIGEKNWNDVLILHDCNKRARSLKVE